MPLSIRELMKSMQEFRNPSGTGRNPKLYPQLKVWTLEYSGWVGTKTLQFKSEIESQSKDPRRRLVNLAFYNLDVKEEQDSSHPFRIKIDDHFFYYSLPTMDTNVGLVCSCPDFKFRSAWYLADKQALIGPRPQYTRKTTTHPSVNPLKKPIMCKHIWALVKSLENGKVLKPF